MVKQLVRRLLRRGKSKPQGERRGKWETRYSTADYEAHWDIGRPPEQLLRLLDERRLDGPTLDLGCGPGSATPCLAERKDLVLALDFSHAAVLQARARVSAAGGTAHGIVAAAPDLPFKSGSLGFVYDRGCLHQFDVERWPRYLMEVERCLRPGGVVLLLEKLRATKNIFVDLLPAGFGLERFEEFEGPMRDGRTKPFLEAVLVKRGPSQ